MSCLILLCIFLSTYESTLISLKWKERVVLISLMISDISNTSRGGMLQSTDTLLLYLCWLFSVFLLWCEPNKWNVSFLCPLTVYWNLLIICFRYLWLIEFFFLWKLFTFHYYISSLISVLSTPYIFQTDYHSSFIAFEIIIFRHCTRPSQHHKTNNSAYNAQQT